MQLPNVKLVLTATSSIYPSSADWDPDFDPNPIDSGSEWTSSLYWGALDRLTNVGWTDICSEANRISAPPSVVLLMSAFNNIGADDSRDLNACYLDFRQFPQAWSAYSTFCSLWEIPPYNRELRGGVDQDLSGLITSSGSVSTGAGGDLRMGDRDTKRWFFCWPFFNWEAADRTVLAASTVFVIDPGLNCSTGYLGDFIVEHLTYGVLDGRDFDAAAEEISRTAVYCTEDGARTVISVSLKSYLQQDIDNHRDGSQYRIRFTGDPQIIVWSPEIKEYYEVR